MRRGECIADITGQYVIAPTTALEIIDLHRIGVIRTSRAAIESMPALSLCDDTLGARGRQANVPDPTNSMRSQAAENYVT